MYKKYFQVEGRAEEKKMTKEMAIKKIKSYCGNNVTIIDNKVYLFDGGLFESLPLSALGSANQELYEAFEALENK